MTKKNRVRKMDTKVIQQVLKQQYPEKNNKLPTHLNLSVRDFKIDKVKFYRSINHQPYGTYFLHISEGIQKPSAAFKML